MFILRPQRHKYAEIKAAMRLRQMTSRRALADADDLPKERCEFLLTSVDWKTLSFLPRQCRLGFDPSKIEARPL